LAGFAGPPLRCCDWAKSRPAYFDYKVCQEARGIRLETAESAAQKLC
jgi:hypothetical protein